MKSLGRHPMPSLLQAALLVAFVVFGVDAEAVAPGGANASQSPRAGTLGTTLSPSQSAGSDNEREWTTGDKSRTVVLRAGTTFVIGPNSRVLRLPNIPGSLGGKDSAKSAYSIELVSGRIDVNVDMAIRPIYGIVVRAPKKIAAVIKAGTATILAAPDSVTVAARGGRDMMLGLGDRWRPLRIGKAFTVSAASSEGAQRDSIAVPTMAIDTPVGLAMGSTYTSQRLSWSAIADARAYLIRLYHHVAATPTLVREQQVAETSLDLGALPPGRYSAAVSAVDAMQLDSAPSPAVSFYVVEAKLPRGAEVFGNTIRLPAAERLTFSDVSGLELSYSRTGNDFVPAPPSVGLGNGAPVSVRLRLKGNPREATLMIEPIDLQATVEMGPAGSVWPGPPVSIVVKLRYLDGRPADTAAATTAIVTVNSEVVDAVWHHEPGRMSCRVDKPPMAGPWVVRVLLRDVRGHAIARDFFEVATATPVVSPSSPKRR